MSERLYTEYPALYDAIQSDWDYDRDISFVVESIARHGIDGARVLELGCGTGEHTRRLVEAGFEVTAIDKHDAMLDLARTKCDADFRQATLPNLPVEGEYDVVIAVRGVINHLPPDDLSTTFDAIHARLADGGIVVFDNSPLPPEGNAPGLDVGTTDAGDYARIAQHVPTNDDRLDWRALTFTPDGEFFVNSRMMTPFDDAVVSAELGRLGYEIETHEGYGPEDQRTVFVGVA